MISDARHAAFVLAFNAGLTLRQNLAHIVPLFDKVIVVEGAVINDPVTDAAPFTPDGHSTDDTRAIISDSDVPISIQHGEGFWPNKTEMCNAAANPINTEGTNWLWQIDSDEFFHADDIVRMKGLLDTRWHDAAAVEFRAYHFWGDLHHVTDPTVNVWGNKEPWRRIFRAPCRFLTHEPPRTDIVGRVVTQEETMAERIMLYHYGYITREQADTKARMYGRPHEIAVWDAWQKDHSLPAHEGAPVVEFIGEHPVKIL